MSKNKIVIIRGPVGAGKTSVVTELRELMEDASIVDFDSFKRQIDNKASSDWRRTLALQTAGFLTDKLMKSGRDIIIDIHSSSSEQLDLYNALAHKYDYSLTSYLLYPPLEICQTRAKTRIVSDILYEIDDGMIEKYWRETFFLDSEEKFSDPDLAPKDIASMIFHSTTADSINVPKFVP
jgi:predicted kinase